MSLSDFTVRFFQQRVSIKESQIMSVVKSGSNVKFGHFSYSTNPPTGLTRMFKCVRNGYGCKAVDGTNLAIINYEVHNHSVSFKQFFKLTNIQISGIRRQFQRARYQ